MKPSSYLDYKTLLTDRLGGTLLDFEIEEAAHLADEITQIKDRQNAVILGHNYMSPELFYTIPDFQGDSLDLCRKAAATDKDVIVFCGVRFMAETAKILNPDKTVLIPAEKAGCSLAEGITAADVRALKLKYPGVPVVSYVNTYADVKAESDICCTSGNAAAVVESLGSDTVIFLPDEYLARNVAAETGRHIIFPSHKGGKDTTLDHQMIGWNARCEVHEQFSVEDIQQVRKQYPEVIVLSHPECSPEVLDASDFAGSTNQIIKAVDQSKASQFLVLTECAMGDNIAAAHPDKEMLRMCNIRCPHMNEITLKDTLLALQQMRYVVEIPEPIRQQALQAVERMIAIG